MNDQLCYSLCDIGKFPTDWTNLVKNGSSLFKIIFMFHKIEKKNLVDN